MKADVYADTCPSREILYRIGGKWTALIICSLSRGPLRFGELRRKIGGISQKMLTQTLRGLERDGLLRRHVRAERPIRVEYELTELGHGLYGVIEPLIDWAETQMNRIRRNRTRFDAAERRP